MRLRAGTELDGFTIVGIVGQGATSEVYRVRDLRTGAERALKLLTAIGEQHRARLEREAQTVAGLLHPNLVGVFGLLDPEDGTAVVMEFIHGPTLYDWLIEVRPSQAQTVWLWRAMLRGLMALHERDLIHRDIKPGNILLSVSGKGLEPKLADYGLIKDVSRVDRQTQTGMGMGTPAYMAPEQLKDSSRVDHRADLYSLACVLFEMLTGQLPFVRDDWWETYKAIEAGTRARFGLLPPGVHPGLESVLRALLEPDPDDRPANAAAVLAMLDGHELLGDPVLVGSEGWRAADSMAERINTVAQNVGIGAANVMRAGAQSLEPADLKPVLESAPLGVLESRRRNQGFLGLAIVLVVAILLGLATWAWRGVTAINAEPVGVAADQRPTGTASVRAVQPQIVDADPPVASGPSTEPPLRIDAPSARVVEPSARVVEPRVAPDSPTDVENTSTEPVVSGLSLPEPLIEASGEASPVVTASVRFKGDMTEAFLLTDDGERVDPGSSIPAGRYQVRVRWQAQDDVTSAGQIQVSPNQNVMLTCRSAFLRCAP